MTKELIDRIEFCKQHCGESQQFCINLSHCPWDDLSKCTICGSKENTLEMYHRFPENYDLICEHCFITFDFQLEAIRNNMTAREYIKSFLKP